MATPESPESTGEAVAERLLGEAKEHFFRGEYREALENDLAAAEAAPGTLLAVRAYRYAGICGYRLDDFEASLKWLNKSEQLARKLGEMEQALFCANHRGATLRRMGRPDEALTEFQGTLREASSREFIRARTRLLANLGVLYDAAGQRVLADEQYARYEELRQLSDDKERRANALGLMARVESLRGRLDEAKWRLDEELKLATEVDNHDRLFSAYRHQAKYWCLARVKDLRESGMADSSGEITASLDEAEGWYRKAKTISDKDGVHRRVMVTRGLAEVARLRGREGQAMRLLSEALSLLSDAESAHAEPRAELLEDLGKLATVLHLNGEALYYLGEAVRVRHALLERLQDSAAIRTLYAPKFTALRESLEEVLAQAEAVPRDESERQTLKEVMELVGVDDIEGRLAALDARAVLTRRRHGEARTLWTRLMGEAAFKRLVEDSRGDLVRSELVYHGAVDDLGRSAHLVVVVFERELRERFLMPTLALWQRGNGWRWDLRFGDRTERLTERLAFPKMLALVKLALSQPGDRQELPEGDFADALRTLFAARREALGAALKIGELLESVAGEGLKAIDIRNQVAHGDYRSRLPNRLDIDAFRRELLIGEDSPLAQLTKVDLTVEHAEALRAQIMRER